MLLRNLNLSAGGKRILGTPWVGVLGSSVPSSGDNGPGIAYNDLTLPADANKAIRVSIVAWPSAGTLFVFEDTSFVFSGAPDGIYSFQYQLIVDGSDVGPVTTVTLQVGGVTHVASGYLVAESSLIAGAARRVVIHDSDGSVSAGSSSLMAYSALPGPVNHDAVSGLSATYALITGDAAKQYSSLTLSQSDIDAIAQRVWQYASRELTVDIAAAVLAALSATTIPVDVQKIRGQGLQGDGSENNPWNPA